MTLTGAKPWEWVWMFLGLDTGQWPVQYEWNSVGRGYLLDAVGETVGPTSSSRNVPDEVPPWH